MSYRILGGQQSPHHEKMTKDLWDQFDKYRTGGAYQASDRNMRILGIFFWGSAAVIFGLTMVLDTYVLPGLRFAPYCLFVYIILCVIKLYVVCEWRVWRSDAIGLEFVPRVRCQINKGKEIENLKKTLKFDPKAPRKKILCCAGNGGGGHEASLAGLEQLLKAIDFPADLEQLPLSFLIETHPNNPLNSVFGVTGEQIYNWGLLKGPMTAWFIVYATSWAQYIAIRIDSTVGVIGDFFGVAVGDETGRSCEVLWKNNKADLILDMTQGTHTFMYSGLKRANMLHIPMLVCITDFEGTGIHSWIENKLQYAVCGTSICRKQAEDFGLPARQIYQTSGMIIRPDFYQDGDDAPPREMELRYLGLDPSVRTCLVCWGGVGSLQVVDLAHAIARSKCKLNIIFLCGRNNTLMDKLRAETWPSNIKICVQGFTNAVSHFMAISDFCVCKPGPGVASEAALLGLPIIVQWSLFTLPQEVPVARWIVERGLGLAFHSERQLTRRVKRMCEMLGDDTAKCWMPKPKGGKGLAGVDMNPVLNRAVFEIPMILKEVFDTHDFTPFSERKQK